MEKITIEERKIIHILLKHLMNIKNEYTYFKNKTGLQLHDNEIVVNNDTNKSLLEAISLKEDGNKTLLQPDSVKGDGIKQLSQPESVKGDGIKQVSQPDSVKLDGSKQLSQPDSVKWDGIKQLSQPDSVEGDGVKLLSQPDSVEGDGIKLLSQPDSVNGDGSKGDDWLYTFFEQELNKALDQYIANGNGQNSLYGFYSDFIEAIAQKNADVDKMNESVIILKLEYTHTLPVEIAIDDVSIGKLSVALRKYLQTNAPWDMPIRIANEFLYLHNFGKATVSQLRKASNFSEGGMAKHLPKMQQKGWIKKLPPLNYALTENSIHILLEVFGIPKTK